MMNSSTGGALRALAATLAASVALAVPLVASAQTAPSYAEVPPYASHEDQIQGRIASFDGAYALRVNDNRGFVDNVQLHQGTVINPTGLTLRPGMSVTILGHPQGNVFAANEIDTPYTYLVGYPYPYPYYGPEIGLGFTFGGRRWR
ncbi:MAG: hypothetical protein ABSD03_11985 [Vulcanimicrobiaceae bacterium]|jgi:invasion protein IalB